MGNALSTSDATWLERLGKSSWLAATSCCDGLCCAPDLSVGPDSGSTMGGAASRRVPYRKKTRLEIADKEQLSQPPRLARPYFGGGDPSRVNGLKSEASRHVRAKPGRGERSPDGWGAEYKEEAASNDDGKQTWGLVTAHPRMRTTRMFFLLLRTLFTMWDGGLGNESTFHISPGDLYIVRLYIEFLDMLIHRVSSL